MAAVTNYRKLGGSEQQEFILSQFWRPEVCNCVDPPSGGSRGETLPCLFQLLVVMCFILLPHLSLLCLHILLSSVYLSQNPFCLS